MENKYYNSEKNVQILVALLKKNNIKKIIASPGTTNLAFLGSLQNDPYFEIYSSVDERSAAYMACGLAAESGEPVVLTCTGATASRNYIPGLTEAFYRKLPVLAVTSHQGTDRIGQLIFQNVDRRQSPDDIARFKTELPVVKDDRDFNYVVMEANKAISELTRDGGGPVHINLFTTYSRDFSIMELPDVRAFKRFCAWDTLPEIPKGKIGIYVGSHRKFTEHEQKAIDCFCATYDAIVICDHTSGYYGKYKILPTLNFMQKNASFAMETLDLMIHVGEVSAAVFSGGIPCKTVWRISEDGEFRDPFKKLSYVFQMPELCFFEHYAKKDADCHAFVDKCRSDLYEIYDHIPELPFSNIWSAMTLSKRLPKGSLFHLSASNTRRCWNMFLLPEGVESVSNVGCCGIDGSNSALLGSSLVNPNRLCYLATGDLAFFYDLNALGNRHVGKNIRILLVNNGVGAEFKLSAHPCFLFGDDANNYMAAAGHFGNKSPELVKHFVQDLGFTYLSATNKEEYLAAVKEFTRPEVGDKPIVFEIFTNHEDENNALSIMCNIEKTVVSSAKNLFKDVLGDKGVSFVKKIAKK
jgi:2-succinyl-5-enolpyruvyl-6-hydroxy-3-cyclohexene-1-carboxylate synthase